MNLKSSPDQAALIKAEALRLGFDACGIAAAAEVSDALFLEKWLQEGCAAEMQYMHNHFEKRTDPRLLVEGCRSVIVVALNYYPAVKQHPDAPQFSYYAYGKDYHEVVKDKLRALYEYIHREIAPVTGRMFTDSAPVLERYWAVKAGLGFIGKNTQLIIPGKGSYFFLGELLIDLELQPDAPLSLSCGNCTRCLEACPPNALTPRRLDARRCISYQTIENKGEIAPATASVLKNMIYGCDICQQVCPWNRFARPNRTPEFQPSEAFLSLDKERLEMLSEDEFREIFRHSAVKRAGYKGLKRNLAALK
ncbi:MAG: tRNA epoxyqueuosine(34) reductase QueG [Bacteroidales bacterium]